MNTAADSAIRTDRFCAFKMFGLRGVDDFFVCEGPGRAGVDALTTECARRFEKFIVEERGDCIFLSAPFNSDCSSLLPIVTDVCAAEARDAVVVVTFDERIVVLSFFSANQ